MLPQDLLSIASRMEYMATSDAGDARAMRLILQSPEWPKAVAAWQKDDQDLYVPRAKEEAEILHKIAAMAPEEDHTGIKFAMQGGCEVIRQCAAQIPQGLGAAAAPMMQELLSHSLLSLSILGARMKFLACRLSDAANEERAVLQSPGWERAVDIWQERDPGLDRARAETDARTLHQMIVAARAREGDQPTICSNLKSSLELWRSRAGELLFRGMEAAAPAAASGHGNAIEEFRGDNDFAGVMYG